jgi:hypothetical protein
VANSAPASLTNQLTLSGGGSPPASVGDLTTITPINACDIDRNGLNNVADVQLIVNQALGTSRAINDLDQDGVVTVVDVQIVINAALLLPCTAH